MQPIAFFLLNDYSEVLDQSIVKTGVTSDALMYRTQYRV